MFSQLFGKYLVEKEVLSKDSFNEVLKTQLATRAKLGTIAVAEGILSEEDADRINRLQMQEDKFFGDIALEEGLLTEKQVEDLLRKQGSPYMQFLEALLEKGGVSVSSVDSYLNQFQKQKGFTQEDMKALKNDDIDSIVPIFAFSSKPFVTDIVSLMLRNIVRFASTDTYLERITHVENFSYQLMAGQKLVGEHTIYIGIAAEEKAFLNLASKTANENYKEPIGEVFDAVGEFVNCTAGLLASELSKKGVNVDMTPVFAYRNQEAIGNAYIVPIYVDGQELHLYLSVDSEIQIGKIPYMYNTEVNNTVQEGARETILIVEDSRMSRKLMRNILEEAGFTSIIEAEDGEGAVELYKRYQPDIVTMDVTMPNMDGIEALRQIIQFDQDAKVIMVTAAGQQNKIIEAIKIGAKKYITKPFEKEYVIRNIKELIKR